MPQITVFARSRATSPDGAAWQNCDAGSVANNIPAACTTNALTGTLTLADFDLAELPVNAVIDGLKVAVVQRQAGALSMGYGARDTTIIVQCDGRVSGNIAKCEKWLAEPTVVEYADPTDTLCGLGSLDATELAEDLSVLIQCNAGSNATFFVGRVGLIIDYSEAA